MGCTLLARNVRLAGGEIDLVVADGDIHVFVEVKARAGGAESAARSVSPDKQRRLGRAAAAWVARHGLPRGGCRFDVITVGGVGNRHRLDHLRGAFETLQRWGV
jgi:putative endonuclease